MSVSDEIDEMFDKLRKDTINYLLEYTSMIERKYSFLDCVDKDIEQFKKDGTLRPSFQTDNSQEPVLETNFASDLKERNVSNSSSIKENSVATQPSRSKRPTRKNGLRVSATVSNATPSSSEDQEVAIKPERETATFIPQEEKNVDIPIKQEIVDMPPPVKRATKSKNTRKRKNQQDLKVKAEILDTSVIEVQKAPIDVIVLEDSYEASETRVTRTRTKARTKGIENNDNVKNVPSETKPEKTRTKRKRVQNVNSGEDSHKTDSDENKTEIKRPSKRKSNTEITNINRSSSKNTEDEDKPHTPENYRKTSAKKNSVEKTDSNLLLAISPIVDSTHRPILNETVVIEKAVAKQPTTMDDLMTDDEDVINESPPEHTKQGKSKQIFSPYENSPVKKRVQAFEKLVTALPDVAGTTTRSRTRFYDSGNCSSSQIPRLFGTPMKDNKLKTLQSVSTSKKTGSALKASQVEFRERELRRKQKEAEALQKKEALIHAQTEEKRRKREERELKVQQSKMALEKDKQKQLEFAEKAKDDKLRQALAEKEAKFFKQKEEAARKRAAALKKAAILKQQEDLNDKHQNKTPAYLISDPPLLPTHDCYDSDEDLPSRGTFVIPEWQKRENLEYTLKCMLSTDLHKKLYLNGQEAPNLKVIFPMIEPAKLKRTSSAIWNTTEMSILESMIDED